MARRRIGRETFHFGEKALRQTSLDELLASIDFVPAESSLYEAPTGEKAWPPLAMFEALSLATWLPHPEHENIPAPRSRFK